ncbi:MAG: twin-arginine translocase TatA/TatE family subunit [Planctomycetota bacterium]|nr:twin-arginine translocase TatA/TatE family subunit [Planctomycetota bacterium]
MTPLFAFFGSLGTPELLIIAFVALLIFGNRLPSVMRSLGKSVTEFKKGVAGAEEEFHNAVNEDKNIPTDQVRKSPADEPVSADKK